MDNMRKPENTGRAKKALRFLKHHAKAFAYLAFALTLLVDPTLDGIVTAVYYVIDLLLH